jgi:hypothetical protein
VLGLVAVLEAVCLLFHSTTRFVGVGVPATTRGANESAVVGPVVVMSCILQPSASTARPAVAACCSLGEPEAAARGSAVELQGLRELSALHATRACAVGAVPEGRTVHAGRLEDCVPDPCELCTRHESDTMDLRPSVVVDRVWEPRSSPDPSCMSMPVASISMLPSPMSWRHP